MAGAIVCGFVFGWLLQRGGVTDYNVVVNQFRFKDFTVLKVMLEPLRRTSASGITGTGIRWKSIA